MALLLVELGSQTAQVLSIFGLLVVFTGLALAGSLLVVEALAVLLLPALDIPVLVSCYGRRLNLGRVGRTRSEAVVKRFVSYSLI